MRYEFRDMEDESYSLKVETEDYLLACKEYVEFLRDKGMLEISMLLNNGSQIVLLDDKDTIRGKGVCRFWNVDSE